MARLGRVLVAVAVLGVVILTLRHFALPGQVPPAGSLETPVPSEQEGKLVPNGRPTQRLAVDGAADAAPVPDEVPAGSPAPEDSPSIVSGTVTDDLGLGVPGIGVFVGAEKVSPFKKQGLPPAQFNYWFGTSVLTDAEGRYAVTCDEEAVGQQVSVQLHASPRFAAEDRGRLATVPARGVDFSVHLLPVLTLYAELMDDSREFAVRVTMASTRGREGGVFMAASASGTATLELPERLAGISLRVELVMDSRNVQHRIVTLWPGAPQHVEFTLGGSQIEGQVVAAQGGKPIAEARVFAGTLEDARGDEPLDMPRFESMSSVLTDAEGRFSLRADATHVSAWHPGYSPSTAPVQGQVFVELGALGSIAGISRSPGAVELDESRTEAVDATGFFQFRDVPAGAHALKLSDGSRYLLALQAGEELRLPALGGGVAASLRLLAPEGSSIEGPMIVVEGAPGDRCRRVSVAEVVDGVASAPLSGAGRAVLLGSGFGGHVDLKPGSNEIEFLDAGATVRAQPESRVSIVPRNEHSELNRFAAAIAARVSTSGTLTLYALEKGPYAIWTATEEVDVMLGDVPLEVDLSD